MTVSDAATGELEKALKMEPGLTVNLLRLTNSVGADLLVWLFRLPHVFSGYRRTFDRTGASGRV
mgnify:CR=1 FL=1